jgi:hypothetical protein
VKKPRDRKLGLVLDPQTGELVGQHPDELSEAELSSLGHRHLAMMTIARAKCRECCCGSTAEIRKCTCTTCPLWPYRMGKRPAARRKSERGAAARAARKTKR